MEATRRPAKTQVPQLEIGEIVQRPNGDWWVRLPEHGCICRIEPKKVTEANGLITVHEAIRCDVNEDHPAWRLESGRWQKDLTLL